MKVADLIKALQQHNQEYDVEMEGCDCYQRPANVETDNATKTVLIHNDQ